MIELPKLGLGCAPLGGLLSGVSSDDAAAVLDTALDSGVRYFDTAPYYGFGLSERRVGDAIRWPPRRHPVHEGRAPPEARPARRPRGLRLAGAPALPPGLRLRLRRRHAVLRGQPAAARARPDRHPPPPRHRPLHPHRPRRGAAALPRRHVRRVSRARRAAPRRARQGHRHRRQRGRRLAPARWSTATGTSSCSPGATRCWSRRRSRALPGLRAARDADHRRRPLQQRHPRGRPDVELRRCAGGPVRASAGSARSATATACPLPAAALQFCLAHPVVDTVIPGARTRQELLQTLEWMKTAIPDGLWEDLKRDGLLAADAPT